MFGELVGWFFEDLDLDSRSQRWHHGTSVVRARVYSSIEIRTDSGTIAGARASPGETRLRAGDWGQVWRLESGLETGDE